MTNAAKHRAASKLNRPVPEAVFVSAERIYAGTSKEHDRIRVTDWTGDDVPEAASAARKVLASAARWGIASPSMTR